MSKIFYIILFLILINPQSYSLLAQNKSAYTWVSGFQGVYARFSGDTSKPTLGKYFNTWPTKGYTFSFPSNICDSSSGQTLFMTNGFIVYDTLGGILTDGDSLVPNKIYDHNAYPDGWCSQNSLILPKGNNGLYYLFVNTITDSLYDYWYANQQLGKFSFNLLRYNVVDMNANGGLGAVVQKNTTLLTNVELNKTGFMACRHANGYDWWLLKQGADSNIVYTFLVKADTIEGPNKQKFERPQFGYYDLVGQSVFNNSGTKYAFCSGAGFLNGGKMPGGQLFVADFDRCYGKLSNVKVIPVPYDSTKTVLDGIWAPEKDSLIVGLAFSPNDSFLYINRRYNIYQYSLYEPDSAHAIYHVQYGPDTSFVEFEEYGPLQLGIDGRIYIGKNGSSAGTKHSYINSPNKHGSSCGMCKKCLDFNNPNFSSVAFPNMPNFNLGALSPCWPDEIVSTNTSHSFKAYPNPAKTFLFVELQQNQIYNSPLVIQDVVGNTVHKITSPAQTNLINTSHFSRGIYYISYRGYIQKLVLE